MSTDAKLPGAREVAHAFISAQRGSIHCGPGANHGLWCDNLTATVEARDAAVRSAVVAERDEARKWARRLLSLLERFVLMTPRSLSLGRLPFAELHDEASALVNANRALATRTGGGE